MRFQRKRRPFVAAVFAAAVLGGCAGSGTTPTAISGIAANSVAQPLVYVVDQANYVTGMYSYPKFALQQTLPDLPGGVCTDTAGNVWFVIGEDILEFAHGGTTPIATLRAPSEFAQSCAVDPTSGTLAVGIVEVQSGLGSIALFAHAKGQPKIVRGLSEISFLTYDSKGNLFGDGTGYRSTFALFELPKGSKKLRPLKVRGAAVGFAGNVQYTKNVLNIDDSAQAVNYETRVAGSTVTVTGKTELRGSSGCAATYIYNDRLLCPETGSGVLALYQYPKGGMPLRTYNIDARAAVVSIDSK